MPPTRRSRSIPWLCIAFALGGACSSASSDGPAPSGGQGASPGSGGSAGASTGGAGSPGGSAGVAGTGGGAGTVGGASGSGAAPGGSSGASGTGGAGGAGGANTGAGGWTNPLDASGVVDPGDSSGTVTPPQNAAAFPSPCIAAGASKVESILSQMTQDEIMGMLGGTGGVIKAVPRLGVPSVTMWDGPQGIRGASQWPCLVSAACTWDPVLEEEVGAAEGKEFRGQGKNMQLGPMANLVRDPRWGRASETYSEDPYLTGKMVAARIRGIQTAGVIADVKHYAANNIETGRGGYPVKVSERTLREIYLPAFRMAVQEGGVWSAMAAYNAVNGLTCGANTHLLKDILKGEWGFPGFVVSDWGASFGNTVGDANAGLDSEQPSAGAYSSGALSAAVSSGKVTLDTLKDKARRILRALYCAGALDPAYNPIAYANIASTDPQKALVAKAGRAGIVLAKNEGGILPIDKTTIKSIAVIGPSTATAGRWGAMGSGLTMGPTIGPLDAFKKLAASGVSVITDATWPQADYVVVCVGINDAGEGFDRQNLDLPKYNAKGELEKNVFGGKVPEDGGPYDQDQNALVAQALAAKPNNTVVVYTGGSASIAGKWSDARSVVIALYPGGDQGNAIADVIFGDYNPAGRLPLTFPQTADQMPPWGTDPVSTYSQYEPVDEGRGWPYFDKHGLVPLFAFGHGLSYTSFTYSNLSISPATMPPSGSVTVKVDVRNSGARAGDEVVQLYVTDVEASVPRRVRDLRGFLRITLQPNEKKTVSFQLTPADLAFFSDTALKWVSEPGVFGVEVGASSRDIRVTGSFTLAP